MSKISVIVPVYSVEKYLSVCINSILCQTFADFDLVLVDDGSPDNCGKICEEYARRDKRIHVIHKSNGGLSDARNYGIDWCIKNSNSEWITFVDSDDYLHPEYISKLYDAAKKNNLNISCCRYKTVYDHISYVENNESEIRILAPEDLFVHSFSDEISPIHNCAWAKLYKKDYFKTIKYPFGRYYEDAYTTHLILFSEKKIAVLSDMLYYYFINPEGITLSKVTKKHIIDRFDSKICRLKFFSEKGFWKPFELIYNEACFDINKWLYTYKNNNDFKKIVKQNKNELFEAIKSIKKLPDGFNYKKQYRIQRKKAKDFFKSLIYNDYKNMKKDTFFLIAWLYFIKKMIGVFFFFG